MYLGCAFVCVCGGIVQNIQQWKKKTQIIRLNYFWEIQCHNFCNYLTTTLIKKLMKFINIASSK